MFKPIFLTLKYEAYIFDNVRDSYVLLCTIKYGIIFKFKNYNQVINDENEYILKDEREEGKNFQKDVSL